MAVSTTCRGTFTGACESSCGGRLCEPPTPCSAGQIASPSPSSSSDLVYSGCPAGQPKLKTTLGYTCH
ncbi:hypothetical protein EG327_011523 [Venturia inaequalis]|uniref:Uncharacterized protein n=1 Tax=Venturia inaequalis TaxID=5025 RepID=A0A8H3UD33_VENIN|nr:hypothetical protein EG327_011523 [Venturia inaequalis]